MPPSELTEAKREVLECKKLIKNLELDFATIRILTEHVVNDINAGSPENLAAAKALCDTVVNITGAYR